MSADRRDADKAVVRAFLARCRAWGTDREIPASVRRIVESATPAEAARLHQWTTWVAFVDHALAELDAGRLDPWFDGPVTPIGEGDARRSAR